MSRQAQLMDVLKKEVRSLLMASKEGLTPAQLEQEYMAMIGRPLPLPDLGFQSTMELVADMPEVVRICHHSKGTLILKAIADETTKDIAKLIAKQKTSVKTRNAAPRANAFPCSRNRQQFPRSGRTPPVLPAAVRSELKDLLSSSPVLLSDFDRAFFRRFGRAFKYMQYGFFSMLEMFSSVSDIVAIEQSTAGSLLTLKRSSSTEEQREKTPQAPTVEIPPAKRSCDTESFHQTTEEKSEPERKQAVDFGDKWKQLEKDFKIMLYEKAAGRTVSSALKEKIRTVVAKYPGGLLVSKLRDEFEAHFKENLCVGKLGFVDMLEFVGSLHDVLHVECKEDERDWLVFDLKSRCLTDVPPDEQSQCEDSSCWSAPPAAAEVSQNASLGKPEAADLKQSGEFRVVTKAFKPPQDLEYFLLAMEMTTSEIPPDAVQNTGLCSLPPLQRRCMVGVSVEFIISPSQFYIQVCSRETSNKLEDLMLEMRRCYSNKIVSDRYIMPESSVQPGQLCCVMVSDNKWWYRVIIHRVLSDQEVEVFYADFGNLGTVQKSRLRFLKWCYLKLPAQAILCSLAWVKPVEGTWTDAATLRFRKLCVSKLLVGIVHEYVNGILHLFLCDTSSKEDIYFHSVLKDEGYAEVCRENVPSQGFQELNPLALYVQPSAKQESAGLVEPDLPLQQESLDVDSGTASSRLDRGELCDQDGTNLSPGMPHLEPVYVGSNFWDKNGLPLQVVEKDTCVSGEAVGLDAAASSSQFVSDEGRSENQRNKEQLQQEWHLSAKEEIWDDVWPLLDQEDVPRTTDEEPEFAKEHTNENTSELMTVVKTPHSLGESSKPAVSSKPLQDFYISIYSNQPAEMSQEDPDQTEGCSNKAQLLEVVPASVLLLAIPFILDQCNNKEKVKNKDLPETEAVVPFSASRLADQEAHQKLYVPPTSSSAMLGATARLAASSGLFQWFPSLKKEV
ncbi:tudor domain-containing protein 5 isoform X2 [Dromaius novaehollandiae]|uniref:tudor domain-containing protein 5 isoform X2 n=1 Tax=Dromaius novaehollandiae TaxID=8790 RepID=UPI00311FAA01